MFTPLEVTQGLFATLAIMSAVALLFGRVYTRNFDRTYEASRWMLLGLMCNLALHYVLQIVCGFRAMGDDVGALANLPFYSTATLLLSFSMLNLLEGRLRHSYLIIGIAFCAAIWLLSVGACLLTGTMHQPLWFIYTLMSIYFVGLVISVYEQVRIFRKVSEALDHNLGNPADNLLRHIRIGAYMLYGTSIVIPFTLMIHYLMAALGFLMMPLFFIFTISFICLDANSQGACEAIQAHLEGESKADAKVPASSAVATGPQPTVIDTQLQTAQIEEAIAGWRRSRGFADSTLSISTFAHRIDIPQRQLSTYFSQQLGCTFRSWITRVRVEEAMQLIRNNPDFSAEAIAQDCGFSSRSFFQTSFKAQTGMTPKEWIVTSSPRGNDLLDEKNNIT